MKDFVKISPANRRQNISSRMYIIQSIFFLFSMFMLNFQFLFSFHADNETRPSRTGHILSLLFLYASDEKLGDEPVTTIGWRPTTRFYPNGILERSRRSKAIR